MQLEPYLFFYGRCEEALAFYSAAFGGKADGIHRFSGSPMETQLPPDWSNKVMHARFEAPGLSFYASDGRPGTIESGNISLSLSSPDAAEAERVFNALAQGGNVTMPFGDVFWGGKYGMLTDRFGIDWMMSAGGP